MFSTAVSHLQARKNVIAYGHYGWPYCYDNNRASPDLLAIGLAAHGLQHQIACFRFETL